LTGLQFTVDPVTSVRDLGIYIHADLVNGHADACTANNIKMLCCALLTTPDPPFAFSAAIQSLVVTLLGLSRLEPLDYGNATLVGLQTYLVGLRRLQSVLDAAAWLTYHMRSAEHISDALVSLHCLRIPERIEYIAVQSLARICGTVYLGLLARD